MKEQSKKTIMALSNLTIFILFIPSFVFAQGYLENILYFIILWLNLISGIVILYEVLNDNVI